MLTAILHGKAGTVTLGGQSISWSSLFKQREDLITATFFGRFQYLSFAMRKFALSLLVNDRADDLGDIIKILYWPSFKPDPSDGGMRVEPDILIECEHGIIIVEVKPEWSSQYVTQWNRQINALIHCVQHGENIDFHKPSIVHYVALGSSKGLNCQSEMEKINTKNLFILHGHQAEWQGILKALIDLENPIETNDKAIINDWISALSFFGIFRPILPLSDYLSLEQLSMDCLKPLAGKISQHFPTISHLLTFVTHNPLEENYEYFKN